MWTCGLLPAEADGRCESERAATNAVRRRRVGRSARGGRLCRIVEDGRAGAASKTGGDEAAAAVDRDQQACRARDALALGLGGIALEAPHMAVQARRVGGLLAAAGAAVRGDRAATARIAHARRGGMGGSPAILFRD